MTKSIIQKSVRPPATNSDNFVPQWNGANSAELKNGLEVGGVNGLASLDGSGKIPVSQLPSTVVDGMEFKGLFSCASGVYPSNPDNGDYYICSEAGTIDTVDYEVGDWLVYTGSQGWQKIDNTQTNVVSQTINDGVTNKSPSEDAVFDALATKANTAWCPSPSATDLVLKSTGAGTATWQTPSSGSGDVIGPASHQANYVPRWNGTPNSKTLVEGLALETGTGAPSDDDTKIVSSKMAKANFDAKASSSLIFSSGGSFPPSPAPVEGQQFWHTGDEALYRYSTDAVSWIQISGCDNAISQVEDDISPALGGDLDAKNKNIFNLQSLSLGAILTTNGTHRGMTIELTVGETVNFGDPLYYDATATEWKICKADALATMPCVAIALETKGDGQSCVCLLYGQICDTDWDWTVGGLIYISDVGTTGNGLTQSQSTQTQIQIVGVALSEDTILFNPNLMLIEVT